MDKSSQQKAKEIVQTFDRWVELQTEDDFRQIVFRDKLNRNEIAKAIGCNKSALRQNLKLKDRLMKLEMRLRPPLSSVLPALADDDDNDPNTPQKYDTSKSKSMRESKRLSELEIENNKLKARVKVLEKTLRKHELMAEVAETLVEFRLVKK
jgi:hypothetical protein